MNFSKNYEELGKKIVEKLRDENFENYVNIRDSGKFISKIQYFESGKNTNLEPEIQRLNDERFEFFKNLTEEQTAVLNRIILNILDSTAFNFMREIEENLDENKSIGLTINGEKVENITNEFQSGTFFGEYFLWADKYSKFGEFQQ